MKKNILILAFIFLAFSNNTEAQGNFACDMKIPIGEAIGATVQSLDLVFQQLENLRQLSLDVISNAESAIQKIGKKQNSRTKTTEYGINCNPQNCNKESAATACKNYAPIIDVSLSFLGQDLTGLFSVYPLFSGDDFVNTLFGITGGNNLPSDIQKNLRLSLANYCTGSPYPSIKTYIQNTSGKIEEFRDAVNNLFQNLAQIDKNATIDKEIIAFKAEPENITQFLPPEEQLGQQISLLSYAQRKLETARNMLQKCNLTYGESKTIGKYQLPMETMRCVDAFDKGLLKISIPQECATTCSFLEEGKDFGEIHDAWIIDSCRNCLKCLGFPNILQYDWERKRACLYYFVCNKECSRGIGGGSNTTNNCVKCLARYLPDVANIATSSPLSPDELKVKAWLCGGMTVKTNNSQEQLSESNLLNWVCCYGGESPYIYKGPLLPELGITPPSLPSQPIISQQQRPSFITRVFEGLQKIFTPPPSAFNFCKDNKMRTFEIPSGITIPAENCYNPNPAEKRLDHDPCTIISPSTTEFTYNKDQINSALDDLIIEEENGDQKIKIHDKNGNELKLDFPCKSTQINFKALAKAMLLGEGTGEAKACRQVQNPAKAILYICGFSQMAIENFKDPDRKAMCSLPELDITSSWFTSTSAERIKKEVCAFALRVIADVKTVGTNTACFDPRQIIAKYNGDQEVIEESNYCKFPICQHSAFNTARKWECPWTGNTCDTGYDETRYHVAKVMGIYCKLLENIKK